MYRRTSIIAVLLATLLLLLQGCATLGRLSAVPVRDTTRAEIPGIPNARFSWWTSIFIPGSGRISTEFEREEVEWIREGQRGPLPPASYLAISGGGDDGAFGAGVLVGHLPC